MKYRAGKIEGYEHVKVCERWDSFENFLADMGERPAGMTLDRKDPWGHYEKDNCRWADAPTQARNKRKKFKCGQDCECPQCLRNRMY